MSVPPQAPYYPPPPKKTPWGLILGLGCGIPVVLMVGCIAVTANKVTHDPRFQQEMKKMQTNTAKEKVTYDPASFKMTSTASGSSITGNIKNKTDETLPYLHVRFVLLDKNGEEVGKTIANISNMAPKSVWNFAAPVTKREATKFEVLEVSTSPFDALKK